VLNKRPDSRETHKYVDDPLNLRPAAQEHVDDFPIATGEHAKADEPPLKTADDEEDPSDNVQCFHK